MSNESILLPIEQISDAKLKLLQKKRNIEADPQFRYLKAIVEDREFYTDAGKKNKNPRLQEILENNMVNRLNDFQRLYNSMITRLIQRRKINRKLDEQLDFIEIKHFAYQIPALIKVIYSEIYQYPKLDFDYDEKVFKLKPTSLKIKEDEKIKRQAKKSALDERRIIVQSFWVQASNLKEFIEFIKTSRDNDKTRKLIRNQLRIFIDKIESEFKDLFVIKECFENIENNLAILAKLYRHDNVPGVEKADYCDESCNFYSLAFDTELNRIRLVKDPDKAIFLKPSEFQAVIEDVKRINRRIRKDLIKRARKALFEKESRQFPNAIWLQLMKINFTNLDTFEVVSSELLVDKPKKELAVIVSAYEDVVHRLESLQNQVKDQISEGKLKPDETFGFIINREAFEFLFELNPSAPKGFRRVSAMAVKRLFRRYKKFWDEGRKKMRIIQINFDQLNELVQSLKKQKDEISDRVNELLFVEADDLSPFIYWTTNTYRKITESRVPENIINRDKLEVVYELMIKIVDGYNSGKHYPTDLIKNCPLSMNETASYVKRGPIPLGKAMESLLVALSELAILGNQTLLNPTTNILFPIP